MISALVYSSKEKKMICIDMTIQEAINNSSSPQEYMVGNGFDEVCIDNFISHLNDQVHLKFYPEKTVPEVLFRSLFSFSKEFCMKNGLGYSLGMSIGMLVEWVPNHHGAMERFNKFVNPILNKWNSICFAFNSWQADAVDCENESIIYGETYSSPIQGSFISIYVEAMDGFDSEHFLDILNESKKKEMESCMWERDFHVIDSCSCNDCKKVYPKEDLHPLLPHEDRFLCESCYCDKEHEKHLDYLGATAEEMGLA
jgi:hypothetical protein